MKTIIDNEMTTVQVVAGHVGTSKYLVITNHRRSAVFSNANKRDVLMLKKIRAEIDRLLA